jgi:hypothetical protein
MFDNFPRHHNVKPPLIQAVKILCVPAHDVGDTIVIAQVLDGILVDVNTNAFGGHAAQSSMQPSSSRDALVREGCVGAAEMQHASTGAEREKELLAIDNGPR